MRRKGLPVSPAFHSLESVLQESFGFPHVASAGLAIPVLTGHRCIL